MKHTILFLAANPLGTDLLALGKQARAIQAELDRSGFRDSFVLETRWAAEPLDLLRELRRLKPTVVHFSGHGSPDFATGQRGLYFQGPDGRPQLVAAEALAEVFAAAGSSVKLVVLSACYSERHAAALVAHVDCVVGVRDSIRDDAARSFAIGFYGGLGERESVAAAYKQGSAAIGLEGMPDGDRLQLMSRTGIDAAELVLASSSPRSRPRSVATAAPRPDPRRRARPPMARTGRLRLAAAGGTAIASAAAIYIGMAAHPTVKVDAVLEKHILTSDPQDPDSLQTVRVVMRPVVDGTQGDLCFAQASESRLFAGPRSSQALEEASGVFEDGHGCEQDKWDFLIPLAERRHIATWRGWVRIVLRRDDRIFESESVAVEATADEARPQPRGV